MIRNNAQGYGWVTIALHWLSALAVFGLFGLGLYMVDLSYYDPWYRQGPYIHKSLGLLLLGATVLRLVWRFANPTPKAPQGQGRMTRVAAKAGHGAIYLLLITLLVSGYLISTADGRAIDVFDWFSVPALITGLSQQEEIAGTLHEYAAWSLMILALGHGLAALKHQLIDRDNTLGRMITPSN
ncbi:cytochrome b [Ferrimonas futtsuensis]|uniref:cytochrome b n=1 Tax=Ferrimonas futtsuensis TaxID=364764 RepID=UPI000405969A|nr:cytochrome b [Ferrimonas futtsuensis]